MKYAPNTRVQRTRSSPSALRSPLTRSPLGGHMVGMGLSLLFAIVVTVACTHVIRDPVETPAKPLVAGDVVVKVGDADGQPLPGAIATLKYEEAGQQRECSCMSGIGGQVEFVNVSAKMVGISIRLAGFADVDESGLGVSRTGPTVLVVPMVTWCCPPLSVNSGPRPPQPAPLPIQRVDCGGTQGAA